MNKGLLLLIILFLPYMLMADVKTFDINDYVIDFTNKTVRYFDETSIDKHDSRYGWIFPIHTELIYDAENYPKYIEDSSMVIEKEFVSLTKLTSFENTKFSHIKPVEIGGRGIVRHNNIAVFESCPFFFVGEDSLFFATRVEYYLTDSPPFKESPQKYQIANKIDMIIITSQKYLSTFERFRNFKGKMGLNTIIKTVEEIYSEYEGENSVMQIRNYIKDMYTHNDIEFVAIGGDYSIVPVGEAYPYEEKGIFYTDAFYSKLDGEPDANGNGVYFELYDYADYYADVFVGRFTGSNESELNTLIDKQIDYYNGNGNQRTGFNTSLFLAGLNVNEPYDGESWCEAVKWEFPSSFSADSMYEQSSSNFGQQTLINALNLGYNIYYHQSHGDYNKVGQNENNWALWSDNFYNFNAISGLYLISSCHPGDISFSGLSQKAMINPNGGCVNYIGSSGEELPGAAAGMHSVFFNQILKGKTIGESLMLGNLYSYGNLLNSPFARYMTYSYNIQGDPSTKLFINEPRDISILGVNQFKKGAGTVNGTFNVVPNDTIYISVFSEGEILSTAKTGSQYFSIEYENLTSDSVYFYYHSQECYLKEYGYSTYDNSDTEIEISNISIIDTNNSNICEAKEEVSLSFNVNVTLNDMNYDSLIVYLSDHQDSNFTFISDSIKIGIPDLDSLVSYTVFDFMYDPLEKVKGDSALKVTMSFQINGGSLITQKELYLPYADPLLELQSVEYDGNVISPKFINSSSGTIDYAEITLVNIDKNTRLPIIVDNLSGRSVLEGDSVSFTADSTEVYYFDITINGDYNYQSDEFTANYYSPQDITVYVDYSPEQVNVEWEHSYSGTYSYNVYIDDNESFLSPELVNFEPLITNSISFNNENINPVFVKVGLIDSLNIEYVRSDVVRLDFIPLYNNTEYKISQYQIFNPMFIEDQLISNVLNSSVSAINNDGSLPNGTGIIHKAEVNGFSTENQQGYAIGDVNGDGVNDMVNYSFNNVDSALVKVIDLITGDLIASKRIYAYTIMENAPVLVDFDSDPGKEILVASFNGNHENSNQDSGAYVYMLDYDDGELNIVSGFPIVSSYGSYKVHSPSLLDLDNNGEKEVLFDSNSKIEIYNSSDISNIQTYSTSGTIQSSLSYCDYDYDGIIEIFSLSESSGTSGILYGYEFDGTNLYHISEIENGITIDMNSYDFYDLLPPVSFPDIDDDGTVDIVVLSSKKIYVFDNEFNTRQNFPIDLDPRISANNSSAPSFGDLDGDTILDILFMDANYRIWCYSGVSGTLLEGFPIQVEGMTRKEMTALPIMDLDGDNDLEFAIGVPNGVMLVYDYPTPTTRFDTYDKFRGDQYNSGLFPNTILGTPANVNILNSGEDVEISWDLVSTATSYKIFVSDYPYTGFIELDDTTNTNYTIYNVSDDKKFYYVIAVK